MNVKGMYLRFVIFFFLEYALLCLNVVVLFCCGVYTGGAWESVVIRIHCEKRKGLAEKCHLTVISHQCSLGRDLLVKEVDSLAHLGSLRSYVYCSNRFCCLRYNGGRPRSETAVELQDLLDATRMLVPRYREDIFLVFTEAQLKFQKVMVNAKRSGLLKH